MEQDIFYGTKGRGGNWGGEEEPRLRCSSFKCSVYHFVETSSLWCLRVLLESDPTCTTPCIHLGCASYDICSSSIGNTSSSLWIMRSNSSLSMPDALARRNRLLMSVLMCCLIANSA